MKLSEAGKYLHLVQAVAAGSTLQGCVGAKWCDYRPDDNCNFGMPPGAYRIKPSPKLRPWRSDEVPVGAVLRFKASKTNDAGKLSVRVLLVAASDKAVTYFSNDLHHFSLTDARLDELEWKWPQEPDAAWRDCGVTE